MTTSDRHRKLYFAIWLLAVGLVTLLIAFTLGAAMFRHISAGGDKIPEPVKSVVAVLAETPGLVKQAAIELRDAVTGKPSPLLIPKKQVVKSGWKHQFPAPDDDGYLLLSGLSAQESQSIVQLIRIADGHVMAKWVPDWKYIHRQIRHHRFILKENSLTYRANHPLLMNDGSLIFNTNGSLVRQPLCSHSPSWVSSYVFHHSVELASDGRSVWAPSVTEQFAVDNPVLKDRLRDDSLAEVSLDGRVIQNLSFSKILADNNLTAHMLGNTGFALSDDPIHINQITPAVSNGPYWQRGDLLISARHLSSVYLYRPSNGKIVWHQQGPWINQHSAHFFKDHAIAVFGNNVYGARLSNPFIYNEMHNQVYLYDFVNSTVRKVHPKSLEYLKPQTITEGRAQILKDMTLFVEETNNGRLFKLDSNGMLQWSYLNTFDEKYLGAVSWSRYISKAEMEQTGLSDRLDCSISQTVVERAKNPASAQR